MHIGYDISSIRPGCSGVGYYTSSLLAALYPQFPDCRFLLFSHLAEYVPSGPNLVRTQKKSFPIKELWMQWWLPRIVSRYAPDLCHFTNGVAPLCMRRPYVVTVHDLSLVTHPEWHPPSRRIWMRNLLRPSIANASGILCDSEATRRDLLGWVRVNASRTWVVPLAARKGFSIARTEEEKETIRARYGLCRPFILYVGNIEPRKNLSRLIEAFRNLNPPGIDLVLAGRRAWLWKGILREAHEAHKPCTVRFLNYVPEDDLPALYQSALAFAYPSLMEGFGLPVLEAMASGTPVLVSDVEPLSTLVHDAGWVVPPGDVAGWQDALTQAIEDRSKRTALAGRGKQIAQRFSWDRVARETMDCYRAIHGSV